MAGRHAARDRGEDQQEVRELFADPEFRRSSTVICSVDGGLAGT
jgi:hypothetical protein